MSINPLSFLLNQTSTGYKVGEPGKRDLALTHLLFVDDLKTYATTMEQALIQLDVITKFTSDIGMKFGADKCAYVNIEKDQIRSLGNTIEVNGLRLQELAQTDSYKYLGVDEDIKYKGEITKARIAKEYLSRVRKIWRSDLNSRNKVQAHNSYAVPVITQTFSILDWTKEEVQDLDVKTRKILALTGSYHRNGDVDRLYTSRQTGGRGSKSVYDRFVARLISVADHN